MTDGNAKKRRLPATHTTTNPRLTHTPIVIHRGRLLWAVIGDCWLACMSQHCVLRRTLVCCTVYRGLKSDDAFVFGGKETMAVRVPSGSRFEPQCRGQKKVRHISSSYVAEGVSSAKTRVDINHIGLVVRGDHHIDVDAAGDTQCGVEFGRQVLEGIIGHGDRSTGFAVAHTEFAPGQDACHWPTSYRCDDVEAVFTTANIGLDDEFV